MSVHVYYVQDEVLSVHVYYVQDVVVSVHCTCILYTMYSISLYM